MPPINVGELRTLIADLPDTTPVHPDWANPPSADDAPGVELMGFAVRWSVEPYLSILVDLFHLDDALDAAELEPEYRVTTCQECGEPAHILANGVAHHMIDDEIAFDIDADHTPVPEPDDEVNLT